MEDDLGTPSPYEEAARAAIEEAAAQTARGVKIKREGRLMSQLDLAREMRRLGFNWHQTTVAKVEGSTRPIRWEEALGLALVFGLDRVDGLMHGQFNKNDEPPLRYEGLLAQGHLLMQRSIYDRFSSDLGDDFLKAWTRVARQAEEKYGVIILDEDDGEHPEAT